MDSQKKQSDSGTKEKGGKNRVIIICGMVVIIALIGIIIYLLWPKTEEENNRNVVVTPDNVEEVIKEMQESDPVQTGYYTVKQNSTWRFENGSSPSFNAYVENDARNSNDVYFDVFLKGEEDNEDNAIYKSPVIPLGSSLEGITLEKALDAGTYDCVMIYHLIDEDQNTLDTLRVSVTLEIES
jgi:hypothetical protein